MNLNAVSDQLLLKNTKGLADKSREILTELLHHLREVEKRRLYCTLKYASLREYMMEELKFSEGEADRRLSAMRLLREIPEIEPKIADGSLSLTNMNIAQAAFTKEWKAGRGLETEEKREVLERLENKSTRAAQKIVTEVSPEMAEQRIPLSFDMIENEELKKALLRVRGMYAHSHPHMTLEELLFLMCEHEFAIHSKANKGSKKPKNSKFQRPSEGMTNDHASFEECGVAAAQDLATASSTQTSKTAAPKFASDSVTKADIRRAIWCEGEAQCSNCGSVYAIQEDHRQPKAAGGDYTTENMRLLCRNCNLRAAIEFYGRDKMNPYVRSKTVLYAIKI